MGEEAIETNDNIRGSRRSTVAHGILVSALGPHFGLGLGLGPGLDNFTTECLCDEFFSA